MEIKLTLTNDMPLSDVERMMQDIQDRYSEWVKEVSLTNKKTYKSQKTKKDPLIDFMQGKNKGWF